MTQRTIYMLYCEVEVCQCVDFIKKINVKIKFKL